MYSTNAVVQTLVDTIKRESFTSPSGVTDAEAFGLLMARYFDHSSTILDAAASALEDANFHSDAAQVAAMADKYRHLDDSEPIDQPMRSAIFAALRDHYGPSVGKDKDRRLAIINRMVRRNGPAVDSLSVRAWHPLTKGEARLVLDVLNA